MRRRHSDKKRDRAGRLPRNAAPVELDITHVGGRGDGVGTASWHHNNVTSDHTVFVPASLPVRGGSGRRPCVLAPQIR